MRGGAARRQVGGRRHDRAARRIGTPDQVREYLRRYEEAGVDQVIFVLQAGRNRHEHIMESIELFGREVLPEFIERDEKPAADEGQAPRAGDRAGAGPQGRVYASRPRRLLVPGAAAAVGRRRPASKR